MLCLIDHAIISGFFLRGRCGSYEAITAYSICIDYYIVEVLDKVLGWKFFATVVFRVGSVKITTSEDYSAYYATIYSVRGKYL